METLPWYPWQMKKLLTKGRFKVKRKSIMPKFQGKLALCPQLKREDITKSQQNQKSWTSSPIRFSILVWYELDYSPLDCQNVRLMNIKKNYSFSCTIPTSTSSEDSNFHYLSKFLQNRNRAKNHCQYPQANFCEKTNHAS